MWKMIHRNYRRLVAFMLTVTMVLTNVGLNLTTAFAAGETENALFLVDGAELRAAIRDAGEQGEEFSFSSLELQARKKSIKNQYESLLGKKEGKVYQLDLDIDDSYAPEYTSLEVFYHAGTEQVVFLFINESDLVVSFCANIDGYVTTPVTVKPNTFQVEDEEDPSFAENHEAGDMIDDVQKKLGAEVLNPQDPSSDEKENVTGEDASSGKEDGETLPSGSMEKDEESTGADAEESEAEKPGEGKTEETGSEEETSDVESGSTEETTAETEEEAPEESETEAEIPESEPETEAEEEAPEENEISGTEEEKQEEELLSLSRHEAALVAVAIDALDDGDESAEIVEESLAEDREEEESEGSGAETEGTTIEDTEAEGTEAGKETGEKEPGEGETGEEETKATEETETSGTDETETGSAGEDETDKTGTVESEDKKDAEGEDRADAVKPGEAGTDENGKDVREDGTSAALPDASDEDSGKTDDVSGNTGSAANEDSGKEKEEGQLLEDDTVEAQGELTGKEYETVTIRDHVNAKAFRVAWEDIRNIVANGVEETEELQMLLDAIKRVIRNYRNGVYETDEELEAAVEEITVMLDALGDDDEYPEELIEAMAELQEILGLGVKTLETEGCTCEYLCTWFWGEYIKINEDCPVCSHATEEELDPYTYDPDHPEDFVCKGKQIVIPGKKENCKHNAVISGGSLWDSWFPGGGSPELLPATCHSPATDKEAIECMNCGARWLWSFEENSEADPDQHYYGRNDPEIIKEATCTEDGLQVQTCKFCGDIETVIKGGHVKPKNESEIITEEATCKDGFVKYTCTACGEKITEVLPGHHTFPTGNVPNSKKGVCTECGATAYQVYTYEDGATPSGRGYETKLCARIIVEKDGEAYGVDDKGKRLEDDGFTVIINEALMGKNKFGLDENGNSVMTQVTGYRNMDDKEGEIYEVGGKILYQDVPGMFIDEFGSAGNYYSDNTRKIIYLEAVREPVRDGFEIKKVEYDFAPSAPNAELRKRIKETSDGIQKEKQYNNKYTTCMITYTIPEGYKYDEVNINATADMMDAYREIQDKNFGSNKTQPGDTLGPVFIQVVNKSKRTFSYVDESIVLQSDSHEDEKNPYLDEIRTFDGTEIPEASVPSRVSNGALRYLRETTTDGMNEDLTDEALDELLKKKGYPQGIKELHQYYLDYYNYAFSEKYGKTWKNLSEIPYELLVQRDEGIFGGQSSAAGLKETNPEVAGVGYSFMYTRLMSVVMGDSGNLKDEAGTYAVGNYMKKKSPYSELNANAASVWEKLEAATKKNPEGTEGTLSGLGIYFNGETNDFYQNTRWAVEVGFRLKNETGRLEVTKSVTGSGAEGDKAFPFTVTLTGDLNEDDLKFIKENSGLTFEKQEEKDSWKAAFTLKDGETKAIDGIPLGTEYEVEEADSADYTVTTQIIDPVDGIGEWEKTGKVSGQIREKEEERIVKVNFNNHRDATVKTGNLVVSKTVSGGGASTSRQFTFTVTLGDSTISGEYGDMIFENGVATFHLAHGQSKMAKNLPAGVTYEVAESDYDGYTSSSTNASGMIPEAEVVTAAFNNHRPGGGGGGGGNGGGSDGPRGGDTPGGPGTTTNIEEPTVPLANFPGESVNELIEDTEVPLAALPRTGDSRHTGMLLLLFGMAGIGAILSAAGLRKRKDESEG